MDVHRVVVHGAEVADTNPDPVPRLAHQRRRRRKDLAVDRQDVEVVHLQRVRASRSGFHGPFTDHEREVAVDPIVG